MANLNIGQYSQTENLRRQMKEAGMTHGERQRVVISGLFASDRIPPEVGYIPTLYFCGADLTFEERLEEGDGGPLPDEVQEEIKVPDELVNAEPFAATAIISSNGRIRFEEFQPV